MYQTKLPLCGGSFLSAGFGCSSGEGLLVFHRTSCVGIRVFRAGRMPMVYRMFLCYEFTTKRVGPPRRWARRAAGWLGLLAPDAPLEWPTFLALVTRSMRLLSTCLRRRQAEPSNGRGSLSRHAATVDKDSRRCNVSAHSAVQQHQSVRSARHLLPTPPPTPTRTTSVATSGLRCSARRAASARVRWK